MHKRSRTNLTDDDYLLFPAKVHGYSLSDREWCMYIIHNFLNTFLILSCAVDFRIDDVTEIIWNPDIFGSLELDADNKYTIRALIESQCNEKAQFDDFVLGKGRGLIFNLHGSFSGLNTNKNKLKLFKSTRRRWKDFDSRSHF